MELGMSQLSHNSMWVAAKGAIFEHPHFSLPPPHHPLRPTLPPWRNVLVSPFIISSEGPLFSLQIASYTSTLSNTPHRPINVSKSDLILFRFANFPPATASLSTNCVEHLKEV